MCPAGTPNRDVEACVFAMVLIAFPPFAPSVSFYEIKYLQGNWNVE